MTNSLPSLRQRLLVWLLLPLVLLSVFWAFGVYELILHFTNVAYDRALEDSARTLAGQVRAENKKVEIDFPPAAREMLEFDTVDRIFFSVSDSQGNQLLGNAAALPMGPRDEAIPNQTRFYDALHGGWPIRVAEYALPISGSASSAVLAVRVAETLKKREILARDVLRYVLVSQGLFIACIAFLIWYGIGRGMLPFSRIRDVLSRRTHEDLSPLPAIDLPAEMHEQVTVINGLMQRLGKTIATQQRFIADATHQLRTPITVLRTQIELALRIHDSTELHAALVNLDAAAARLVHLANQLLSLSRYQLRHHVIDQVGAGGIASFETLPFSDLVDDVVAELVPAALAKHIEITVQGSDAVAVRGNAAFLHEMVANLVDNAIFYTPRGGKVEVSVEAALGVAVFSVTDTGPGIPSHEAEKVWERFYRSPGAPSGGSGLGLAIAREIALMHDGSIHLAPAPSGQGLRAKVVIAEAPLVSS